MKVAEINKLGKELELYTSVDYVGKGFPIIMPRGSKIIKTIRNYIEWVEENNGYRNVRTPSISNSEIYKIADRYSEEKSSYFIIKNENINTDNNESNQNEIVLKPNVQPFHCSIYKLEQHSYKDLPVKYCETSTIFRNERDIKGIMRTRQITLSDASIFCDFQNVKKEIKNCVILQQDIIKKLGLELKYVVSNWNDNEKEKYIGQINEWNTCFNAMQEVLDELGIKYETDEKARMYGPAIKMYFDGFEFSVLQIDFEMPHRFDLKFKNEKNEDKTPIYIHNTIIGSYENLLSVLIDRYNGFFPLVIAPVQVCIIDDGEIYNDYSNEILKILLKNGIRAEIDKKNTSFQEKFQKNLQLRVPYIVKIGKQELNSNTITVAKVLGLLHENQGDATEETDVDGVTNIETKENIKIEGRKTEKEEIEEKSNIKFEEKTYKINVFIEEVLNCQTKF